MYRVLTVAREFGSGGADIARIVADRLSWKLLDSALITGIAEKIKVDPQVLRKFDECVDPWTHRLVHHAMRRGAFEGPALIPDSEFLDANTTAHLTHELIRKRVSSEIA